MALPLPRVPDERQADCYAAGAAPRPHFQDHTRKALTRRGYGGGGDGDNLSNIDFLRQRGLRLSFPRKRESILPPAMEGIGLPPMGNCGHSPANVS